MTWEPPFDLVGDSTVLRVSASDLSSSSMCGRHLALKVRPEVRAADWDRSFPTDNVFPLGTLMDVVAAAHRLPVGTSPRALQEWLQVQFVERGIHRLLRLYLAHAVGNLLDVHEAVEAEVGALRLLVKNPVVGDKPRQFTAWGPLYQSRDGVREIRRYRLGAAHAEPEGTDQLWTATGAYVAAAFRGGGVPNRVRVAEVGAGDGSSVVTFDGTPEEAVSLFEAHGRERAELLAQGSSVEAGRECGECKAAGVCEVLAPLPGMLGQDRLGYRSRSISPSALDEYGACPGRWFLHRELHLPAERDVTEARGRGESVHRWLAAAHLRGVPCSDADLPLPGDGLGLAATVLSPAEYAAAYPFLRHHAPTCPLRDPTVEVIAVGELVYGFDDVAQVVPVAKPDLIYRAGERLVVRKVQTTMSLPPGRDEAFHATFHVPFLVAMLGSGLTVRHHASRGCVELELLSPAGSQLWVWDADDPVTDRDASAAVRRAAAPWHHDDVWATRPGRHCTWCPVRRWCPDQDSFANDSPTASGGTEL